ncbi:MAG: hypothetical protein KGL39_09310 [Patescibacteria group bacterium]|nr:hypothetical protein [Patescibacteria group bacterium]
MSTAETDEKNRGVCRALAVLTAKYAVAPEEAFMVCALNPSARSPVQPADKWDSVRHAVRCGWRREVSHLYPGSAMQDFNYSLADSVVGYGGLLSLRWLFAVIPSYLVIQVATTAIREGKESVKVLKWLYAGAEHVVPSYDKYDIIRAALEHGNLPVLEWIHAHNWIADCREYDLYLSKTGRVDLMQWSHERGYRFKPWSFDSAARFGHIDAMEWLHGIGCRPTAQACYYAAKFGVLKSIEWFRKKMGTCPCGGRYHP